MTTFSLSATNDGRLFGNELRVTVYDGTCQSCDQQGQCTLLVRTCFLSLFHLLKGHRGLIFSWWGCYGLCFKHKPTDLAHFPSYLYSILVSVSVFMAHSTVFHSLNSPENSLSSHSVLLVLFLPYWSSQLYISL